ncbi:MAG: YtzH-like family protein [Bacillus sp. (in: firmicutes)]
MPLSQQHQVSLLKDILTNHSSDCCGSVSECEQIERLAAMLLENGQLTEQTQQVLNEIHHYSQRGQFAADLDGHITSHQGQLTQWVSSIDQYS